MDSRLSRMGTWVSILGKSAKEQRSHPLTHILQVI